MKASCIAVAILGCLLAVGCATDQKEYGKLEKAGDDTKLNISFSAAGIDYQRTVSEISRTTTGWVENGIWQSTDEAGVAEVRVYIATLYYQVFKKKRIREMRALARGFSRQSNLDYGTQGIVTTNTGPIDYIFYRTNGQACVLIRKYWNDPALSGDIIMLDPALNWVAGRSFIYASDCRPGYVDLQLNHLNRLFNGIKAKNLYWPDDIFVSADGTLGGGEGL